MLVSAGYDSNIRVWDVAGCHSKRIFRYDEKAKKTELPPVLCLAVSKDGTLVLAGSVGTFKLFNIEGKQSVEKLCREAHTGAISKIGFQSDCQFIYTAGDDKACKIWDLRSPVCSREIECRAGINDCVLHPNQGEIITADEDGFIRVWDLVANKIRTEVCPEEKTPIHSLAVSNDGNSLAACYSSGRAYIWEYDNEGVVPITCGNVHGDYVLSCAISPNNQLLATSSADRTIRIWDIKTLECLTVLKGHERWVWDCQFSRDSKMLVSGSSDHTCRLWDLASSKVIRSYIGHERPVSSVVLHESAK